MFQFKLEKKIQQQQKHGKGNKKKRTINSENKWSVIAARLRNAYSSVL